MRWLPNTEVIAEFVAGGPDCRSYSLLSEGGWLTFRGFNSEARIALRLVSGAIIVRNLPEDSTYMAPDGWTPQDVYGRLTERVPAKWLIPVSTELPAPPEPRRTPVTNVLPLAPNFDWGGLDTEIDRLRRRFGGTLKEITRRLRLARAWVLANGWMIIADAGQVAYWSLHEKGRK